MCASSKILLSLLLGISQCTSIAVALSLRVSSCAHGSIKQHSFPCDDGYRHVVDKRRRTVVAGWLTHFSLLPFINVKKCHAQNLPKATGADLTKTGTTEKLAPILELEEKLRQAAELLKPLPLLTKELQSKEVVVDLSRLLSVIPTHEGEFKRLFDEYSDPISYKQKYLDQNAFLVYYTKGFDGPGRPSIESVHNLKQTIQYGARNDAWIAIDELRSEIAFAGSEQTINSVSDIRNALNRALLAMEKYISLVPIDQMKEAHSSAGILK